MSRPIKELPPIEPLPSRWQPSNDPSAIHVPGLDTDAPVNEQIEQIEQLITVKLQNIDVNFAKMHDIMSSRILPAFKRFAVGTEPVREAAKFWTTFYEQAAQVRLTTLDEFEEPPSQEHAADATVRQDDHDDAPRQQSLDYTSITFDHTPSETSFKPDQAAFSSTPAAATRQRMQNPQDTFSSTDGSFAASLESPLVRLDRDLREFAIEEDSSRLSSARDQSTSQEVAGDGFDEEEHTIHASRQHRSPNKGKSRERSLREDILRTTVSPLHIRAKHRTPVSAARNPYLPRGVRPQEWSGIVDLHRLQQDTPHRRRDRSARTDYEEEEAEEEDESLLPPGMSPPQMVPFNFNSVPSLVIGRSPRKDAATRIRNDLIHAHAERTHDTESSSMPTPPSYSHLRQDESQASSSAEATLESLMRRYRAMDKSVGATSEHPSASTSAASVARTPQPYEDQDVYTPNNYAHYEAETPRQEYIDEPDMDASLDSLDDDDDEVNSTAHPSAAFLLASAARRERDSDDSLDDDDEDTDDYPFGDGQEGLESGAPLVHPLMMMGQQGFNDSFDDGDSFEENDLSEGGGRETGVVEETVFGLPPARRAARASEAM